MSAPQKTEIIQPGPPPPPPPPRSAPPSPPSHEDPARRQAPETPRRQRPSRPGDRPETPDLEVEILSDPFPRTQQTRACFRGTEIDGMGTLDMPGDSVSTHRPAARRR